LNEGKHYGLAEINVKLGVDQTIVLQFNINDHDRSYYKDSNWYTLPGMTYALYSSSAFDQPGNWPFFNNTATGISLNGHSYQVEIRIPASVATAANCPSVDGQNKVVLYLEPTWVVKTPSEKKRVAMDPDTISIGAISGSILHAFYTLYVREANDIVNITSYIPDDFMTMPTETKNFGPYIVYVCNLGLNGVFRPENVDNQAIDGILLIDSDLGSISDIEKNTDWGNASNGWRVKFDDVGLGSSAFQKSWDIIDEWYDILSTSSQSSFLSAWDNVPVGTQMVLRPLPFSKYSYFVGKATNDFYLVGEFKTTFSKDANFAMGVTENTGIEIVSDIAISHLMGHRINPYKDAISGIIKAGNLGSVLATDGMTACEAWRDGDYAKAVAYTLEAGLGSLSVIKGDMKLPLKPLGDKGPRLKFSSAATVAIGTIEVGYDIWKYETATDEIEKLHYAEAAWAGGIDTAVSMIPGFGTIFEASWSITVFLLSCVVPDYLAQSVCSSPGTGYVFLAQYFANDCVVPSAIAKEAYYNAACFMIENAKAALAAKDPTLVVLPK
jgi:hypothetical protein